MKRISVAAACALMVLSVSLHAEPAGKNASPTDAMLPNGADVNARNADGQTALMDAAASNKPEIVRLLLEKGADAGATSADGETALSMATDGHHKEAAALLEAAAHKGNRS